MNSNRKLAHVERISNIESIPNADNIVLATVLGWKVIVKKSEFQVGDPCVYIEIDSIVDKDNPNFTFLEKKNFKIKTMKMKGVISQGIAFPVSILPYSNFEIGDDVTAVLKVTQIEDDVPKMVAVDPMKQLRQKHKKFFKCKLIRFLMRYSWFRTLVHKLLMPKTKKQDFPNWIVKTDETRLQNMPDVLETYKDKPMIVTEKIDGTSASFGLRKSRWRKYDFAVCSRNVRLADCRDKTFFGSNVYYEIAAKYKIKDVLKQLLAEFGVETVVLQGEIIGETIQKNKYGLTGRDFYAFNLVIDGRRIDSVEAAETMKKYGIKWVPILETDFALLPSVSEMIQYADGESTLCDTLREGVVIRDHENTTSFKCISNQFLLKHNL